MLLFPLIGLGLARLHMIRAIAWAGSRPYRQCRSCFYRDCRGCSNARPYDNNYCAREENGVNREYNRY